MSRSQRSTLPDFTGEDFQIQPLSKSETIPSSWYVDPCIFDFEKRTLFTSNWQYAGHVNQLTAAGEFICTEVAGNPLVIMRDKSGAIKGYYNVCKHRGGPLVTEDCGHLKKGVLQCKYHGWTYLLDGSLRGVPRFDRTDLFDKKDFGLTPVQVAVWEGLVFVCLQKPEVGVNDLFSGIAERILPMRLDDKKFHKRFSYNIACNWKVYVDNYLEGYHIPLVHPELCKVLDYRAYVTETAKYHSLQYSPIKDGEAQYGAADGDAFYYFVFPNMMLNILPGRVQVNLIEPVSPNRCRVVFDYFYDDISSPKALKNISNDLAFSDQVQDEDIEICEHVQRGLASAAYDRGRFSVEAEAGVYHFQCLLKEQYRSACSE